MRPFRDDEKGSEVVGDYFFIFAFLVNSGHTSQFANGSFSCEGGDPIKNEFFTSVAESISFFCGFYDLDNDILIFSMNSCWKDAENAGGGEIFCSELSHLSDSARKILIFFIFKVHVASGSLIFLWVDGIGVSLHKCPGAVIGVHKVSLEAIVVVSEREPKWNSWYLRR